MGSMMKDEENLLGADAADCQPTVDFPEFRWCIGAGSAVVGLLLLASVVALPGPYPSLSPVVEQARMMKYNAAVSVNGSAGSDAIASGSVSAGSGSTGISTYNCRENGWRVLLGGCTVDPQCCLLSPNYPDEYEVDDACYIKVGRDPGRIKVEAFETADGDFLYLNDERYDATYSPDGVRIWSDIMIFETDYSDSSLTGPGFKLCLPSLAEPYRSVSPVGEQAREKKYDAAVLGNGSVGSDAMASGNVSAGWESTGISTYSCRENGWRVLLGGCTVDPQCCLLSPNYPDVYRDTELCYIKVGRNPGPIKVELFDTGEVDGLLFLNDQYYSGGNGPDGVIIWSDIMVWKSYGVGGVGFKLCLPSLCR